MAANAGAIRAGRAYVEMYADNSKLLSGLRKAQAQLSAWGTAISAAGTKLMLMGGAALAGFGYAAKTFMSTGDALDKMNKRTGASVEFLSALDYTASMSGTSLESLETGFKRMARTLSDADRGLKTSQDALAKLGLTAAELRGMSPEQQFTELATRISAIEDPTQRAASALEIFGRAGTSLLPMFSEGAAGFNALMKRAKELGLVMSTEDAQAAAALNDQFDELWMVVKRVFVQIGASLMPVLRILAELLKNIALRLRAWVESHRAQIVVAAKAAVAVLAFGAALWTLGKIIMVVAGIYRVITLAVKAYATAQAVAQALSGPKGWIILAAGMAAAAAAAYGINLAWEKINGEIEKASKALSDMPSWEDMMKDIPKPEMPELGSKEVAEVTRKVTRTPMAAGVFNAQRLATLGGGLTSTDKIVEHTKATAKNTKEIADNLGDGDGETFG